MVERERKFLITDTTQITGHASTWIHQGYLVNNDEVELRVRLMGDLVLLTVKSGEAAVERDEFEYELPSLAIAGYRWLSLTRCSPRRLKRC